MVGGPVLIFTTDFNLILKIDRYLQWWGYHDIMFTVRHRKYHLGWACLRCHRFHWGAGYGILHVISQVIPSTHNRDGDSGLLVWGSSTLSPSCLLGDDSSGASFWALLLLSFNSSEAHQASTKCPNRYLSRILHKLGWPYGSCLLTLSGVVRVSLRVPRGLFYFTSIFLSNR